jgi:hypothetical protein
MSVLYNHLSPHLCQTRNSSDAQDLALLKQVSPIVWQHINFHDRYEFNKRSEFINMNEIIQELAQVQMLVILVNWLIGSIQFVVGY